VKVTERDCLYLVLGHDDENGHIFTHNKYDGRYMQGRFKVSNASVGNVYLHTNTINPEHKYYILLDREGTISDAMEISEIVEHFKFVEAST